MAAGDITKIALSGSTNGRGIKVAATAIGSGTTIHTAHATSMDEIWVWALNSDTSARNITFGFGGTTDPDDLIEAQLAAQYTNKAEGLILVIPGLVLTNSLVLKAAGSTANVITLFGFVNRIE